MNCEGPRLTTPLVMLNEVKHLAHEWEVGDALAGHVPFDAQILRSAQDDDNVEAGCRAYACAGMSFPSGEACLHQRRHGARLIIVCHVERSRDIWLRTRRVSHSSTDSSTALGMAEEQRRVLDRDTAGIARTSRKDNEGAIRSQYNRVYFGDEHPLGPFVGPPA
jgi:hypothetical protein